MTVSTEITNLKTFIANAYTACQEMGATMPAVLSGDNLEQCIASITGGQPAAQGRFVAVGDDVGLYSSDGITWQTSTMPASGTWDKIVYGNSKFVATNRSNYSTSASTDGINWSPETVHGSMISTIVYGNGKFICTTSTIGQGFVSTDGENWESIQMPVISGESWVSSVFAYDKYFIFTQQNGYVTSSSDGVNWSTPSDILPYDGFKIATVAFGNNTFVAAEAANSSQYYAYSSDGINWTRTYLPNRSVFSWPAVYFCNDKFFLRDGGTPTYYYSSDGTNWTSGALPSTGYWRFCYGNNKYIACKSGACAYSDDGINWTETTLSADVRAIAYGEVQ